MIAGLRAPHYSPVDDAISLLAATDAPTRWWMTAGFVCFGVAVPLFAFELRRLFPGGAWIAAIVAGLATLGVAAFPLHVSTTVDRLHGTFASIGYVALALVPLLAARPLFEQGHRADATVSRVVAFTAGVCLALTPIASANGFFQRAGLTVVDVWLIVVALGLLGGRRTFRLRSRATSTTKEPAPPEQE